MDRRKWREKRWLGFLVALVRKTEDGAHTRPLIAKTAMNGAQLLKGQGDSSGLMCGPPAWANDSDTRRQSDLVRLLHTLPQNATA